MTVVQGTLLGHPTPINVRVTATLVDLNGQQRTGYVDGSEGEIVTAVRSIPNRAGAWSMDLIPNSEIATDWGDSLWRVDEGLDSDRHQIASTYLSVPASGGPYWMGDLRTTPPGGASPVSPGVQSVNGQTGTVVLDAADVGADATGAAASAVSTHSADTTSVHGITDTTVLATSSDVSSAVSTHNSATTSVHGITNTANLLTSASAAALYLPLSGDPVRGTRAVYKSADEDVTSSITLQDDDHLLLSVTANGIYTLEMYLDVEADPAADLTMGWTVPSGTVMSWTEAGPSAGNGNNIASIKMNRLIASDSSGVGILATGTAITPSGVVRVSSTAGTLQFRWAQTVSSGTPTRLKAGSWMKLHRIA